MPHVSRLGRARLPCRLFVILGAAGGCSWGADTPSAPSSHIQLGTTHKDKFPPKIPGPQPKTVTRLRDGWWCPGGGKLCLPCHPDQSVAELMAEVERLTEEVAGARPDAESQDAIRRAAEVALQDLGRLKALLEGPMSGNCGPLPPPEHVVHLDFDYCRFCQEGLAGEEYCPEDFITDKCP